MKKNKVVFIQGAYDIINWGHIKSFKLAKTFGDYLIIGLNTNELVSQYKRRDAVLPWSQKAFIISSCKWVDKVVKAPTFSPLKLLKKYKVDVYCITKEWRDSKKEEIAYMKAKGGEVKYLPRFKGVVSTGDIKAILLREAQEADDLRYEIAHPVARIVKNLERN